jgi:hypothetical protein
MNPILGIALGIQVIGGVGMQFSRPDSTQSTVVIQAVGAGLPADLAGVYPGDALIAINGVRTEGAALVDIAARTRGAPGSPIELEFERDGVPRRVRMLRAEFASDTVLYRGFGCYSGDCNKGTGIYIYPSRWRYEGTWSAGLMDGRGRLFMPTGHVIEAEWSAGTAARGQVTYPLDQRYDGEFDGSFRRHGTGTLVHDDGEQWEGEWVREEFVSGTVRRADGVKWEGTFRNEVLHGEGRETDRDRNVLDGEWVDGRFVRGTVRFATGDLFEGYLDASRRKHGEGTFTFSGGRQLRGTWVEDDLPYGEITFAMGGTYTGELRAFVPHGAGRLDALGFGIDGRFADGLWVGEMPTPWLLSLLGRPIEFEMSSILEPILGLDDCDHARRTCAYRDAGVELHWSRVSVYDEIAFFGEDTREPAMSSYAGTLPFRVPLRGSASEIQSTLGTPQRTVDHGTGRRLVYELAGYRFSIIAQNVGGVYAAEVSLLGREPDMFVADRPPRPAATPAVSGQATTQASAAASDPIADLAAATARSSANLAGQINDREREYGPDGCIRRISERYARDGWYVTRRSTAYVSEGDSYPTMVPRGRNWPHRLLIVGSAEIGEIMASLRLTEYGEPFSGVSSSADNEDMKRFGCTVLTNEDRARRQIGGGSMLVTIWARGVIGQHAVQVLSWEKF